MERDKNDSKKRFGGRDLDGLKRLFAVGAVFPILALVGACDDDNGITIQDDDTMFQVRIQNVNPAYDFTPSTFFMRRETRGSTCTIRLERPSRGTSPTRSTSGIRERSSCHCHV